MRGRKATPRRDRIVLCGSFSALPEIFDLQSLLERSGISAVAPPFDERNWMTMDHQDVVRAKGAVSRRHMTAVRSKQTFGVLVVNPDRYGAMDYIGPNTIGEVAVAFVEHKQIFVLNAFPSDSCGELEAWGAIPLYGSVELIADYTQRLRPPEPQLQLFVS
jgi:hypothetical protein